MPRKPARARSRSARLDHRRTGRGPLPTPDTIADELVDDGALKPAVRPPQVQAVKSIATGDPGDVERIDETPGPAGRLTLVASVGVAGASLVAQVVHLVLTDAGRRPSFFAVVPTGTTSGLRTLGLPVRDIPVDRLHQLEAVLQCPDAVVVVEIGALGEFFGWARRRTVRPDDAKMVFATVKRAQTADDDMKGQSPILAASQAILLASGLQKARALAIERIVLVHNDSHDMPDADDVVALRVEVAPCVLATAILPFHAGLDIVDENFVSLAEALGGTPGQWTEWRVRAADRYPAWARRFDKYSFARAVRDVERLTEWTREVIAQLTASGLLDQLTHANRDNRWLDPF